MNKFATYESQCAIPTFAETVQRHIPEAAGLSEAQCLALCEEAKSAAPADIQGRAARAEWIAKYFRKKLKEPM